MQDIERPAAGPDADEVALAEAELWLNMAEVSLGKPDPKDKEGRDLSRAEECASK